jgi:signal transduction histidine kinase
MQLGGLLAKFVPTDPGYAPFGVSWLRGLNGPTLGLVALFGLLLPLYQNFHAIAGATQLPSLGYMIAFVMRGPVWSLMAFMPMVMLVGAADHVTSASTTATRVALLTTAVLLGAGIEAIVGLPVVRLTYLFLGTPEEIDMLPAHDTPMSQISAFARATVWGGLLTALLYFYKRERDAAQLLHATQLRRLDAERHETDARLLSLQAQIEPHFLFNTLAHVQRLYEVEPERGRAMLSDLVDYLRSALPQMRRPGSTVGRELSLARAYLNVQQLRMGDRLRVDVEVSDALSLAALPPLMLVTLVENAIKHGVGPKPGGGTVRITAHAARERLRVEVHDDGVGLKIGAGAGRGLANIRARLATQFGSGARLEIGSGPSGGVRAAIDLPITFEAPATMP